MKQTRSLSEFSRPSEFTRLYPRSRKWVDSDNEFGHEICCYDDIGPIAKKPGDSEWSSKWNFGELIYSE